MPLTTSVKGAYRRHRQVCKRRPRTPGQHPYDRAEGDGGDVDDHLAQVEEALRRGNRDHRVSGHHKRQRDEDRGCREISGLHDDHLALS
jgi:hypothetical protein